MVFAIHQHESATAIHMSSQSWNPLPPPSPPYPSGLSQSTGFGCPASCMELALFIYFTYSNVYVSTLFSQIIPPLPSPAKWKSLFFTSLSPLLPCMSGSCYHFSKFHYMCYNIQYLSFSLWLTSLCITRSRVINLIRSDSNVFLLILE